jgi:hypothetical protein
MTVSFGVGKDSPPERPRGAPVRRTVPRVPPTRARDLLAGAVVLLVSLSLARLAVDHEMIAHADALRRGRDDSAIPVIEHLRVWTKAGVWIARIALTAAVVAWMVRARRIVQGYDCDLFRSDPDFAASGWFMPGMNLVAPYLLMADVWTASNPSRQPEAIVDRLPVPRRIVGWWLLFLLSVAVGMMEAMDVAFSGTWAPFDAHLDYVMTGSQVVSALLLLWVVVQATSFIERRYDAGPSGL